MLVPVIKVRYKLKKRIFGGTGCHFIIRMSLIIVFLSIIKLFPDLTEGLAICDKTPYSENSERTEGNNGFSLKIIGSTQKYRSGQKYTLVLSGKSEEDEKAKFQGFMIVAEPQSSSPIQEVSNSLGVFKLVDFNSKFSLKCAHAVEAVSSMSKEEVRVEWIAPSAYDSGCIDFKAMVIERPEVWYMDEGSLTYSVCQDDSPLATPMVVKECCACDEAKYEVIFEGIWSRHTHPKDFPEDEWRTAFSQLIGASHSINYTLWEYGRRSSPALDILAQHGYTRKIEAQMKMFSHSIRSVIKAKGLQQRSNIAGQTFAVFRVDPVHHLMSFVTKMMPSPDWLVGLSNENLCLSDCTWVANRVVDLYPWDIGVESGLRYDSGSNPTVPKSVIQRITSTHPDNSESPFWDETGAPMKPVARLHLIRQRTYRKACQDGRQRPNGGSLNPLFNSASNGRDSYIYNGEGIGQPLDTEAMYGGRMSNDQYGNYEDAVMDNDFINSAPNSGDGHYTSALTQGYGGDYDQEDPCLKTEWGMWSQCSSTCGPSSRNRRRMYLNERMASDANCPDSDLLEKEPCRLPKCKTKSYSVMPSLKTSEGTTMTSGGYSTPWSIRGLESDGLTASHSYAYETQDQMDDSQDWFNGFMTGGGNGYQSPAWKSHYTASHVSTFGNSYTYDSDDDGKEYLPPPSAQHSFDSLDPGVDCRVSEWGEWSDCSSECDRGTRTRTRRYVNPDGSSACMEELDSMEHCLGDGANCPTRYNNEGNREQHQPPGTGLGFGSYYYNKPHYNEGDPQCTVSEWSEWSPCSSRCHPGYKKRTRLYMVPFIEDRSCDIKLFDKSDCYGNSNNDGLTSGCNGYYGDDATGVRSFFYDDYGEDYNSVDGYDENDKSDLHVLKPEDDKKNICLIDNDPGPCRGSFKRWFFDASDNKCKTFVFHGCNGNKNNFASQEECLQKCGNTEGTTSSDEAETLSKSWLSADTDPEISALWQESANNSQINDYQRFNNLKAMSYIKLSPEQEMEPDVNFRRPNDQLLKSVTNCIVSTWSEWSPCSVTCGIGWATRQRQVMLEAGPKGKKCPKKMHRKRKCRSMPCPADTKYWYQGSWRHMDD